MTHHVPLISAMTLQNFREIASVAAGQRSEPTAADHEQVNRRALEKRAPFHLPKNSVADALLMELYRSALNRFGPDEPLCFVTANYEDFSAWKGDRRLPHSDFADLFDERRWTQHDRLLSGRRLGRNPWRHRVIRDTCI